VRIYLIAAIGLLIVRGIASVVDTLDALSAKLAGPTTPLRHYHDMRGLVPLLRRCVELAIWLAAASLILLQIEAVAAFASYGPRLIQAVGVFFVARVAVEAANLIITRSQGDGEGLSEVERQQRATLVPLVLSFVRGAIYFVALAVMLSVLDLNPLPLLAGAGILGVVVGFGAQPVITDIVSGFFILFENQFLVGDYVETGNARGVVEAIQLRTTRIRDPNGQQHIVRNGLMTGVVNYSKAYTFAVVEVEVRNASELEQVYGVLREIGAEFATKHPDVLEPTVISGIERFTSSGLVIRTTTKVRPGTHGQVARDLRQAILTAFVANGLNVPAASAAS
jgi:small conductance mechanosensitive channel